MYQNNLFYSVLFQNSGSFKEQKKEHDLLSTIKNEMRSKNKQLTSKI